MLEANTRQLFRVILTVSVSCHILSLLFTTCLAYFYDTSFIWTMVNDIAIGNGDDAVPLFVSFCVTVCFNVYIFKPMYRNSKYIHETKTSKLVTWVSILFSLIYGTLHLFVCGFLDWYCQDYL